jgi:hypothetical protein
MSCWGQRERERERERLLNDNVYCYDYKASTVEDETSIQIIGERMEGNCLLKYLSERNTEGTKM